MRLRIYDFVQSANWLLYGNADYLFAFVAVLAPDIERPVFDAVYAEAQKRIASPEYAKHYGKEMPLMSWENHGHWFDLILD